MNSTKHLILALILTIIITVVGTAGYTFIEGWPILDALYMTVITISTVGYGEVNSISTTGRIFTIILVVIGFGFAMFVGGSVVQFLVEGRIRTILGRRRLDRKIKHMKNHFIVCGYGRIGRILCRNLRYRPIDLVVIERDPDLIPVMEKDGVHYLSGDATDETNLERAGVMEAKSLVAVLATDADNVFLVLTARQLNSDLHIVGRASNNKAAKKIRLAGASRVETPYDIGAASMAQRILRPTVTSFLDLALAHSNKDIQMEEIPVPASSPMAGVVLKDSGIRQKYNLIIIAIKKPDGSMLFNPSFETVIEAEDTVIAVGKSEQLIDFSRTL